MSDGRSSRCPRCGKNEIRVYWSKHKRGYQHRCKSCKWATKWAKFEDSKAEYEGELLRSKAMTNK